MNMQLLLPRLLALFLSNTLIAVFLTAVDGEPFPVNFIYSQCIGSGIFAAVRTIGWLCGAARYRLRDGVLGTPLGGLLGFLLGTWANGFTLAQVMAHPRGASISVAAALFFGALGTYMLVARERLADAESLARAERLRRVEQEALAAQTELRLLQAQIEPHFLFNTLSTVVSLVDTQPATARAMLLDLTSLLRTSLTRARKPEVSLGEELELLQAYLGIMAARMGPRLDWRIEAEDGLRDARLPPLLVQPLVENAVRHGLEPKAAGGYLAIRCRRQGGALEIAVEDSGAGLDGSSIGGTGLGLANVRQRLAACYGEAARLELFSPREGGTRAVLSLPLHLTEAVAAGAGA